MLPGVKKQCKQGLGASFSWQSASMRVWGPEFPGHPEEPGVLASPCGFSAGKGGRDK